MAKSYDVSTDPAVMPPAGHPNSLCKYERCFVAISMDQLPTPLLPRSRRKMSLNSIDSSMRMKTKSLPLLGLTLLTAAAPAQTFSVLHKFSGNDGSGPHAELALSGNVLYGTTRAGGSSGRGTVFKLNTNGTSFTVLKQFSGADGADDLHHTSLGQRSHCDLRG